MGKEDLEKPGKVKLRVYPTLHTHTHTHTHTTDGHKLVSYIISILIICNTPRTKQQS